MNEYCTKCGEKLGKDNKFCTNCGEKVKKDKKGKYEGTYIFGIICLFIGSFIFVSTFYKYAKINGIKNTYLKPSINKEYNGDYTIDYIDNGSCYNLLGLTEPIDDIKCKDNKCLNINCEYFEFDVSKNNELTTYYVINNNNDYLVRKKMVKEKPTYDTQDYEEIPKYRSENVNHFPYKTNYFTIKDYGVLRVDNKFNINYYSDVYNSSGVDTYYDNSNHVYKVNGKVRSTTDENISFNMIVTYYNSNYVPIKECKQQISVTKEDKNATFDCLYEKDTITSIKYYRISIDSYDDFETFE